MTPSETRDQTLCTIGLVILSALVLILLLVVVGDRAAQEADKELVDTLQELEQTYER